MLKTNQLDLRFGDIVLIFFPYYEGDKLHHKQRPGLVLYNEPEFEEIQLAMISSTIRTTKISRIPIAGLPKESMIYLANIATIKYKFIQKHFGTCSDELIAQIKEARWAMDNE